MVNEVTIKLSKKDAEELLWQLHLWQDDFIDFDPRTIRKIIRGESYIEESGKLDELGELDYPKKKNIWIEKLEEGE